MRPPGIITNAYYLPLIDNFVGKRLQIRHHALANVTRTRYCQSLVSPSVSLLTEFAKYYPL